MTFTREQLIAKAREQIEFCRHTKITGEGRTHVNQCSALFEIALAALTAEPVYFVEIEGDQDINAGRITGKKRTDLGLLPDGINPLYAVPPAPVVVPDSLAETLIAAIEKEQERLSDEDYLMDSKDCIDVIREEMKHLNACRAAMLQGKAEPVSQPYTLPEGYALVPVDATRAMIDAARCVEEDGYDAMHKAMLAAAPQQEVKP